VTNGNYACCVAVYEAPVKSRLRARHEGVAALASFERKRCDAVRFHLADVRRVVSN
jgi:hypothetical protein